LEGENHWRENIIGPIRMGKISICPGNRLFSGAVDSAMDSRLSGGIDKTVLDRMLYQVRRIFKV